MSYGSNGLVASQTTHAIQAFTNDTVTTVETYTYDDHKRAIKAESPNGYEADVYYDSNDNITEKDSMYPGQSTFSLFFDEYDDGINPFYSIPVSYTINEDLEGVTSIDVYYSPFQSKHNPVLYHTSQSSSEIQLTNTYDANDNLIQISANGTSSYSFIYDCN